MQARRREADKLPDMQKVDCITVNLVPFKTAIDMLFQVSPLLCSGSLVQ